jgi:CheY-like chemotaxis protein
MTLDLEPVFVSSMLANSLSITREKAAARQIQMHMEASADLESILVDARKVKQIVYNLLSNAVKFTSPGGQVSLAASRVPRADVGALSGNWKGRSFPLAESSFAEFLKISVTDTGIGISPEGLEQLFKPFSQIDSGLARKFEGTGLGLNMVKLLAELHEGAVAVESAVGLGSCFTVWLPLRTGDEPAIPAAGPVDGQRNGAQTGTRTALVVEDDLPSAVLIRLQLEDEGFKVLHAATAQAALGVAAQHALSLITLDIQLADVDGWEFLSRLKKATSLEGVPIVIVSIVADQNRGLALGAAAVLQKPLARQELHQALVDLGLSAPAKTARKLHVLVVDDDPKAVEMIGLRIRTLGCSVLHAHGGREAIEIARSALPDLIVLDLMMREVSGFDVVEALGADPDTARIPVVVVTAKQVSAEERAKLGRGVTMIIGKAGLEGDRFIAGVKQAMSGQRRAA